MCALQTVPGRLLRGGSRPTFCFGTFWFSREPTGESITRLPPILSRAFDWGQGGPELVAPVVGSERIELL